LAAFDLTLIGRLSPDRRGEASAWVRRQAGALVKMALQLGRILVVGF